MLTATLFLPLAGSAAYPLVHQGAQRPSVMFAVGVTIVELALTSIVFFIVYRDGGDALHLVEKATWIESLNVQYFLGVDGLSAPLVFLTGLLGLSRRIRVLEGGSQGKGTLLLASGVADRRDGRLHVVGLCPVLHLLGTGTGAHVLPDLYLGHGPQRVLGHEVPHLHHRGDRR